ncbi:hypothetical protein [Paracoccus homiensis]|uniref:Uncharacterized protein n=1 Tax=Paracoccus homiensis TaxID=364199 RepID=A0A1I0CFV3_9RHOB|nr:hypothetical protein [Paracoccus homiensis]SET17948.1 hypothetical protein SAMN04489858_103289 [Paracoccus homiensis]
MPLPRAPDRLSDEMAAALGHAVSGFGFLEEALKRAIFSLTRQGLGEDADDAALEKWLRRMEDIADDSLGTLIDSFGAAMRHARIGDRDVLYDILGELRLKRNLLCHASWRPGAQPGYWHPTFINTRGERFPDDLSAEDVLQIHADTLRIARRVVSIMRATGIDGEWAGHDDD